MRIDIWQWRDGLWRYTVTVAGGVVARSIGFKTEAECREKAEQFK